MHITTNVAFSKEREKPWPLVLKITGISVKFSHSLSFLYYSLGRIKGNSTGLTFSVSYAFLSRCLQQVPLRLERIGVSLSSIHPNHYLMLRINVFARVNPTCLVSFFQSEFPRVLAERCTGERGVSVLVLFHCLNLSISFINYNAKVSLIL